MKLNLIALIFFVNFSQVAFASIYDVLEPYPAINSVEEQQEVDKLIDYQNTRTQEQCALAQSGASANLTTIFGQKNGPLSQNEIKKLNSKLKWITIKSGIEILVSKNKYARPRPYISHQEVKPCIDLENTKSYPSGHAAISRMYARILSVIYPERAPLIMQKADEFGLNRIIGGVHYPSDVEAGKMLGDAMAEDYLADNDAFYRLRVFNYR